MNDSFSEPPDRRDLDALHDDEALGEYPPIYGAPEKVTAFEDLTLAEALAYLILRPGQTARELWRVLSRDPADETPLALEPSDLQDLEPPDLQEDDREPPAPPMSPDDITPDEITGAEDGGDVEEDESHDQAHESVRLAIRLGALIAAVLFALRGGHILHHAATDPVLKLQGDTDGAASWFIAAALIYLGVETWFSREWWVGRFPRAAAWMRGQFDLNPQWNAALVVPLLVLLVLLSTGGGVLFSTIVLVLIAVIWLMLLLGLTPPVPVSEQNSDSKGVSQYAPTDVERLSQTRGEIGRAHV